MLRRPSQACRSDGSPTRLPRRACLRITALEDARADKHPIGTELHHHRRIRGSGDATGGEQHDRKFAFTSHLDGEVVGRLQFLRGDEELVLSHGTKLANLTKDLAHVRHCVRDITGAGLALRSDHRRTLGDASQRLPQICGTTHERHGEAGLVDVIGVVGRSEHL
jgi:hypothetical protein